MSLAGLLSSSVECRDVHDAADQCSFILRNCLENEAGLASYLSSYYCTKVPHAIVLIALFAWLIFLLASISVAANNFFSVDLTAISKLLGLSESVAGVTFVAFGNGSSDLFTTFAAMSSNSGSLAIGELIGAASLITAVVAGSIALVRPHFEVHKSSFVTEVGFFIVATIFLIVALSDGKLSLWECIVMILIYTTYVFTVVTWHWWLERKERQKKSTDTITSVYTDEDDGPILLLDEEPYTDDDGIPSNGSAEAGSSQANEHDSGLLLPQRNADESIPPSTLATIESPRHEYSSPSGWPSIILPEPYVLLETLFPGLASFTQMNLWQRTFAIASAPIIFVLSVTIPVVEIEERDASGYEVDDPYNAPFLLDIAAPSSAKTQPQRRWNRWLLCLQILLAPLFVTWVLWENFSPEPRTHTIVGPVLIVMAVSLVVAAIVITTTNQDEAPFWHPYICFLGFIVGVAWISTIASEVVGVLQALAIILNVSDAILGLTIFATGNSINDLVADIALAKRGYPVMALSACFGGPMLNILLGIGLGAGYRIIKVGAHKSKYMPYEIGLNSTLIISGFTLLAILLYHLTIVPWNGWKLDKRVGFGLIGLWAVATTANIVVEFFFHNN